MLNDPLTRASVEEEESTLQCLQQSPVYGEGGWVKNILLSSILLARTQGMLAKGPGSAQGCAQGRGVLEFVPD